MSTYLEFDHPEEGLHTLELKEPKEVAADKIASLLRCLDPDDPKRSFTAYFCFDVAEHVRQHECFMAELGLTETDLERASHGLYEDIEVLDLTDTKLAWQVQAYDDGRIYGVYYLGGELRNLEIERQNQSLQNAGQSAIKFALAD